MKYTLKKEINPSAEDVQVLGNGIMAYATERKGHKPIEFFAFFVRDENGEIKGGCSCCTLYGCLYVDQLWLEKEFRGKGHGRELMLAAENLGREEGCSFAAVNTMDWEALGFYQKLGYEIEFERHGFLKESVFYFLRKSLAKK